MVPLFPTNRPDLLPIVFERFLRFVFPRAFHEELLMVSPLSRWKGSRAERECFFGFWTVLPQKRFSLDRNSLGAVAVRGFPGNFKFFLQPSPSFVVWGPFFFFIFFDCLNSPLFPIYALDSPFCGFVSTRAQTGLNNLSVRERSNRSGEF